VPKNPGEQPMLNFMRYPLVGSVIALYAFSIPDFEHNLCDLAVAEHDFVPAAVFNKIIWEMALYDFF
jgi:hypothetical protein